MGNNTHWKQEDVDAANKRLAGGKKMLEKIEESNFQKKVNKFGAVKVMGKDGKQMDSKRENSFKLRLESAGIPFIEKERIVLQSKFRYNNQAVREIAIEPDFMFYKGEKLVAVVDTKGLILQDFKNRWKMLQRKYFDAGMEVMMRMPRNKHECEQVLVELIWLLKK